MTSVSEQYFKHQIEYEKKYGPQTLVIYQVGDFYEVFEYDPKLDPAYPNTPYSTPVGKATLYARELSITLTKKQGDRVPYGIKNPYMAGFNRIAYESKFKQRILLAGFKIVRFDEKERENKDDDVVRFLAENTSEETQLTMLTPSISQTNFIVIINLELYGEFSDFSRAKFGVGFSCLDLGLNLSYVDEFVSKSHDLTYPLQSIRSLLSSFCPKELIIVNDNSIFAAKFAKEIGFQWAVLQDVTNYPEEYSKEPYQKAFFNKFFNKGNNIIDQLGLQMMHLARYSYLLLLQYCFEHDPNILIGLKMPELYGSSKYLVISNNSKEQLNLIVTKDLEGKIGVRASRGSKVYNSIFSVINHTITPLGTRLLFFRLTNPLIETRTIRKYHSGIQKLIDNSKLREGIISSLSILITPDLERIGRKIETGTGSPQEVAAYFLRATQLVQLYDLTKSELPDWKPADPVIIQYNRVLQWIYSVVDLTILQKTKTKAGKLIVRDNFIKKGINPELDQIQEQLDNAQNKLKTIAEHLNQILTESRGKGKGKGVNKGVIEIVDGGLKGKSVKSESEESERIGISATPSQINLISKIYDRGICGEMTWKRNKQSRTFLHSDLIDESIKKLTLSREMLADKLKVFWTEICKNLSENCHYMVELHQFVASLDFLQSGATAAITNKYFCPEIIDSDRACFEGVELRHPMVERTINCPYIPNNISLEGENGYLIYGVNSSGKSVLAKTVGINIILAQMGYFTAGKVKLSPYRKIMTRLSGEDDIIKGDSSYIVELKEIGPALKNADEYSLVLGDELCRGTESVSAVALTVATIKELVRVKSNYIFSTHLHELPEIKEIQEMVIKNQLKICHLSVRYDLKLDELIYQRKLEPGPGEKIYGLEVAKYYGLPQTVIKEANRIRAQVLGETQVVASKASRYNSRIYVDQCFVCHCKINLETHHLVEQKEADSNGMIGTYHKNEIYNLAVLCRKCHDQIHSGKFKLETVETLKGPIIKII